MLWNLLARWIFLRPLELAGALELEILQLYICCQGISIYGRVMIITAPNVYSMSEQNKGVLYVYSLYRAQTNQLLDLQSWIL